MFIPIVLVLLTEFGPEEVIGSFYGDGAKQYSTNRHYNNVYYSIFRIIFDADLNDPSFASYNVCLK